ncbi:MAG: hypothetical protein K6E63_06670 [Lachnospiraceae bacterium]|nr:hypothetical protein [Lachnospiraceae bacterium]
MKKYLLILAAVPAIIALSGCGHVEGAKKLYKYACEHYGSCEMIDKDSHGRYGKDAYTVITCRDDEYGFTYTVKSYMTTLNFDGAKMGHSPITVSDFEAVYARYIYETCKEDIDAIGKKYNIEYVLWDDWLTEYSGSGQTPYQHVSTYGIVRAYDSTSAGEAAVAIGELYRAADTRDYFITDREEHEVPTILGKPMEPVDRDDSLGKLSVDDLEWHSIEEQRIQSQLEKAWTYDVTAEYVGQHSGVFSETGASLDDVLHYGNDYPKSMDSPVLFYDFVTDEGKEFWITDFSVKPPYGEHKGACSNYSE